MSGPAPLVAGRFAVDERGTPWLLASRCELCGRFAFPPRSACPRCRRRSMSEVRLGEGARLYSFTVCHSAPSGWPAPYLQAYVELPEGIRVFTLISDEVEPGAEALEVGAPMELVVEPVHPDAEVVTYKYRPASRHNQDDDA